MIFPTNCRSTISEVWHLPVGGFLVDVGAKVLVSYSWKYLLGGYDLLVLTPYFELVGILDSVLLVGDLIIIFHCILSIIVDNKPDNTG